MKNYDDFSREELIGWIVSCDAFFDENHVDEKEGLGILSIYGRLIKFAESKNSELAALRARVEKLEAGIFNMRKCVAENAGIRNEYQDFEEVFEIAQNLLGDIPSEAK